MFRKMMVPVGVALVLTTIVATGAMAAGTPAAGYGTGQCTAFVNADGDGACDNVPAQDGTGSQAGVGRGGRR